MFYPALLGKEDPGIPDMLLQSISEAPQDYRAALSKSIILSGGNTMFPGFSQRLKIALKDKQKEMRSNLKCKVIDPLNRKILVFLGAAIVAMILENHPDQWISKADWAEEGPWAVYKFYNE